MARHTHGNPNLHSEIQSYFADFTSGYVVAGGIHSTSGSTTATLAACQAYISQLGPPRRLRYVEDISDRSITYAAGNGVYWVIMHTSIVIAVSGWTRVTGTHYLYKLSATEPVLPNRSVLLMQVTVAAGAITTMIDCRHRVIGIAISETFSYTTYTKSQWTFSQEGSLVPASGVTVSHAGKIVAGSHQIFDLSAGGLIGFPNGATVQAEWWGAQPGVDSANAIESALNAATKHMRVQLNEGIYLIGSKINSSIGIERDWRLVGRGLRATILQRATAYTGTMLEVGELASTNGRYIIDSIGFDGIDKASGTVGVRVLRAGAGQVIDCLFENLEKGYWQTSGVSNVIRDTRVEDCSYGIILDNGANTPTMFAVQDSSVRNCSIVGVTIDGSTDANGLLRNIQLDRVTIEADTIATGMEWGLRICEAQQINVRNCWFESVSRFVDIQGGTIAEPQDSRPTAFIKFDTCNFGRQNDNANLNTTLEPLVTGVPGGQIAFRFNGVGANDGQGCEITNCDIVTSGPATFCDYEFNQTNKMLIRNTLFLGESRPTGTSWYKTYSSDTESLNYEENVATENWRPARLHKDDATTVFQRDDMVSTETTTNATPTIIAARTISDDSTVYVVCSAVARSADNAISAAYMVAALVNTAIGTPGVAVVIGGVQTLMTPCETSAGMAFTLNVTGGPAAAGTDQIRAVGTGVAATTITWQVEWKILRITAS